MWSSASAKEDRLVIQWLSGGNRSFLRAVRKGMSEDAVKVRDFFVYRYSRATDSVPSMTSQPPRISSRFAEPCLFQARVGDCDSEDRNRPVHGGSGISRKAFRKEMLESSRERGVCFLFLIMIYSRSVSIPHG